MYGLQIQKLFFLLIKNSTSVNSNETIALPWIKNRKATNRKVELERTKHTFRQELCFSSKTKRSIINHQLSFSVCERKTEQINNLSCPLMMAGYVVAKLGIQLCLFFLSLLFIYVRKVMKWVMVICLFLVCLQDYSKRWFAWKFEQNLDLAHFVSD